MSEEFHPSGVTRWFAVIYIHAGYACGRFFTICFHFSLCFLLLFCMHANSSSPLVKGREAHSVVADGPMALDTQIAECRRGKRAMPSLVLILRVSFRQSLWPFESIIHLGWV